MNTNENAVVLLAPAEACSERAQARWPTSDCIVTGLSGSHFSALSSELSIVRPGSDGCAIVASGATIRTIPRSHDDEQNENENKRDHGSEKGG